jgi:hypothetical protein
VQQLADALDLIVCNNDGGGGQEFQSDGELNLSIELRKRT